MKKTILILGGLVMACGVNAQEPADALRFSWTVPSGTARQQAIGGAMGSLGGDITANFVNPAGLAFYRTGDVVLSPGLRFGRSKANYLNRTEKEKDNNGLLGTSGFVIGSGNNGGSRMKNVALSIAYTRSADFNNNFLYRGTNNQSSYTQKYLEDIRGVRSVPNLAEDFPFGASLAFNTYLLDTVAGGTTNNYTFQSRSQALLATGLLQEQQVQNKGGIHEFALGLAAASADKFMFGASLNIPLLSYERETKFTEADATDNPNNKFNFATINESLSTKGTGFNLKAGLIYKPVEQVRLGLAFHTPTIYSLTDRYSVSITNDTADSPGSPVLLTDYSEDYTDGALSEFKYMLITPYRAIASASYVLRETEDVTKQKGFITADLEYVNYKASSFETDDAGSDIETEDYLTSLNSAIDNAYKGAFNFRLGGELKFTTLMVRAGAAYYGNPYKNIQGEKGSRLNLSGGLGYRNRGMFVDLTYVHSIRKDVHFPYRLETSSYPRADIRTNMGNVLMTVGMKF